MIPKNDGNEPFSSADLVKISLALLGAAAIGIIYGMVSISEADRPETVQLEQTR